MTESETKTAYFSIEQKLNKIHDLAIDRLNMLHDNLRDGYDYNVKAVFQTIDAYGYAEIITREEARLWILAIQSCPGHDNEGGRDWCAYCGIMKQN